ncbi:MAG: 50S ribosomal protein L11 methyltransferase [Pseudomonadota bacterium]
MNQSSADDIRAFIVERMPLAPVAGIPEIRLHQATSSSGLSHLATLYSDERTPFWAFAWAGGLALARHVLGNPTCVAGRRVLDLGAGSGLVAIAAAMAGASAVSAADVDALAMTAIQLNAAANGVEIACIHGDLTDSSPPDADLILAGDVFYDRAVAKRVLPYLRRCAEAGAHVLIGDPNRAPLPRNRLRLIAHYNTGDVGESALTQSYVYALR